MKEINIQYYKSPVGEILLGSYENKLCLADWRYRKKRNTIDDRIKKGIKAEYIEKSSESIELSIIQLMEYFGGKRKVFDILLLFVGTEFQKNVWNALLQIQFGEIYSYPKLAKMTGNEKAVRAAANASGANAISIFAPCHRSIASNGALAGYTGGLNAKKNY